MRVPMTMLARVEDCVQLTYRTPAESVRGLLPAGLELVQRGPWAFWSVSCSQVKRARPRGVPAVCGVSYTQVAYRLHVQAMTDRAEVVRGLYFVRSDVSTKVVSAIGNLLADFRMQPASVAMNSDDCGVRVRCGQGVQLDPATRESQGGQAGHDLDGPLDVCVDTTHAPARLAPGSCFPTVQDARRLCRFTPHALTTHMQAGQRLLRVTRVDYGARPCADTPLSVHRAEFAFFKSLGQHEQVELEWASRLSPMDVGVEAGQSSPLLIQPRVIEAAVPVAG